MSSADALHARLAEGPIPFRDWMDACLYGDGGYYVRPGRKTGAGTDADFATNPTLHPFFAQCVAKEIQTTYEALGRPEGFGIWEFGGGEGDLARDATSWLQEQGLDLPWHHVEISPAHQEAQGGTQVDQVPEGSVGFVVAHEFLDALPVHLMERRKGDWAEIYVGLQRETPTLQYGFPTRAGYEAAPKIDVPEGHRVVAHAGAKAWLSEMGTRLSKGRVLIVDYGDEGMRLWGRDPQWGTLRTFRQHQDGGDPLQDPGDKDITASLDFAQLRDWAGAAGLDEVSFEKQEAFLIRHGALEAMNAEDRNSVEGASRYLRLRQMVLPTGMGDAFRVQLFETS